MTTDPQLKQKIRRTVLIVALLNFAYFFVEIAVAVSIGSVSLFADSVDFLEDTAVNLLIFMALGWAMHSRAIAGKVAAVIICVPAIAAAWEAFTKANDPVAPDYKLLIAAAAGAAIVNLVCALMLVSVGKQGGALGKAAFLAARNDVLVNIAIIITGIITIYVDSGWPDIILGVIIIVLNFTAAKEVWEVATEERLEARAMSGDITCECSSH